MTTISIPSGELEYIEKGNGPPLVLLHGGTGSIEEWGASVDAFAERYRVIAYNRRGYGRSTPRTFFPEDYYDEDITDLVDFLHALQLRSPVFFCGFSDGGTIALMFAARFPERLQAMVVAGAHIYVEDKTAEGLARVRAYYRSRHKSEGLRDTPQVRSQMAWFDRWLGPAFRPFNIEAEMPRIQCPTLVVQGTEDEFARPGHAEDIASGIAGAELWLVEGARHWIHGGRHATLFEARVMAFFSRFEPVCDLECGGTAVDVSRGAPDGSGTVAGPQGKPAFKG